MSAYIFWLTTILLVIVALAFLVLPLLKTQRGQSGASREDINKAIYHGKVEDLRSDLDKGLLDKEEYEFALADLQKTLLLDAQQDETTIEYKSSSNWLITLVAAIGLPVMAFTLYKTISTGQFTNAVSMQQPAANGQPQSLESSIAALEERLKDKPDNVEGWKMLGQSYFVMQRYDAAKQSYLKALDLVNQADPELLVLTAEASAFSNNELFADYEKSLLQKALSINPRHERALWYSGYAAYTSSDYDNAVNHWQSLLVLVPAERPEVKDSLLKFLNDARRKAGMEVVDNEQSADLSNTQETQGRSIKVSVQLNENVNAQANSSDALFIYARPANGPKMPLSLARMTVSSLPVTVTLTEAMAMMPSMTINSFDKVEVLARVSKSGQAITQAGDLISTGVIVDFSQENNASVSLDINSIVE